VLFESLTFKCQENESKIVLIESLNFKLHNHELND